MALIFSVCASSLLAQHWRDVTPRLKSEVKRIEPAEAQSLLASFCRTPVRYSEKTGLNCEVRNLGPAFTDLGHSFHPETVIYGHFLNPQSEDVAVGGWGMETHPLLSYGTLLLTRRATRWVPLWYKSAVVTHSCHKAAMPSGRELLLCEEHDGGMGHKLHYLYSVDLATPVDIRKSLLAMADSFVNYCMTVRQEISRVDWYPAARKLTVILRTPESRRTSLEVCAGDFEMKRAPLSQALSFDLTNSGFRAVPRR